MASGTVKVDGARLMQNMTMVVDTSGAFGAFGWRLRLAGLLFRAGCAVLRCGLEIK